MSLRSIITILTRVLATVLCTLVPASVPAVDSIDLGVADIRAPTWSASGIRVHLDIGSAGHYKAQVTAQRANFADALGELTDIAIDCAEPLVRDTRFSCRGAKVSAKHARYGQIRFAASVDYDRTSDALSFDLAGLRIAAGTWRVSGQWRSAGWQLQATADRLPIAQFRSFVAPWVTIPADIDMTGTLAPRVLVKGRDAVESITVRAQVPTLTLNNADGSLATDQLAFDIDATLVPIANGLKIDARLGFTAGQAYRDPIFLDLARNRVNVELAGTWVSATERLNIARYVIDQPGILRASGSGVLAPFAESMFEALNVSLEHGTFPGVYANYLQPFLVSSDLKDLITKGSLRGSAELQDGSPKALDLELEAIDADDKGGRMAMHGLSGQLAWRSDPAAAVPSRIAWRDGKAYGFTGGAAQVRFVAAGRDFRMLEAAKLPVFDGGLAISTFEVRDAGLPSMSLLFDATLEPISMRRICQVLGWPEFSGTVAGRIPRLTFKDRILSLDGDLEARVFDGHIVVSRLRLEDPLGAWPRLFADIDLNNLDLQAVTGTFSFGEITGRLSGSIHALELFAWRPVAFDAVLATPAGDRSEHRISQRAVSNISAIGGGSSGNTMVALSSGVLKFFENFKYERLGLACKLANDVCLMQGVGPAAAGYYIVKGRGIPRIDVIGTAGRIDWPQLVANLEAATHAGPATTTPGP